MGITVSYRGSIADLARVEDMEDRVIDLALEVGGNARIWRSACDHDPKRVVRGVIVNLCPGQETTSLLISPEGRLISLLEIEAAEKGELSEPSWCFVKTQFGPVVGHVALVELFTCLKNEFIPDLEIHDEGGYYESRDIDALRQGFARVGAAIEGLAEGLRQFGLSREAAEDPEILASRIERIAQLVHRTLSRTSEHPPAHFDDDSEFNAGQDGSESQWDLLFKENRGKQERIERAVEEKLARGEDYDSVFESALCDEGLVDLPGESSVSDAAREFRESLEPEEDEPWKASLPEVARGDFDDGELGFDRHPLQQRAMDLMVRLHELAETFEGSSSSHISTLHYGSGEIMGGLAQALGSEEFATGSGLSIVQLKRALRGAAFALGSLFSLRAEGVVDDSVFDELHTTVESLQGDILEELRRVRGGNG